MDRRLLVREFIDEISQRAEKHFQGRLHQAFLDWYIEAEFGQGQRWNFMDDVRDGGIDAVVWRTDDVPPVIVVQSKFAEHVGSSPLTRNAYRDFRGLVDIFYYRREGEFEEFLAGVREDLKRIYRKAFDQLASLSWSNEKKAFRLVTTTNRRPRAEFDRIPADGFVYANGVLRLYDQYRTGTTPRARPLELTVQDKLTYKDRKNGMTSYLFNAELEDFRKYLDDNDVARLVARNIRYNLGGKVGRDIRTTYETKPSDFWYLHNGLTIICDDFTERGQVATLTNPNVVNGAQTLYAISGSARRNPSALVTTRVIVRGNDRKEFEDDKWVQRVIQGVNTQNRVRSYDFRSNEPEQVELQNKFRDFGVFYERKRGAWSEFRNEPRYRNFERLSLRTLGVILATVSDRDGRGVLLVKRGLDGIFAGTQYRRLFPWKASLARRFKRIYFAYRLYRLLDLRGYRSAKEYRKQRQAFWNTLWMLHCGITSVPGLFGRTRVRTIQEAFDTFEGRRTRQGRSAAVVVRKTRKAVWSAWRKARVVDPEQWTANNFFKSKFGNRKTLNLAFPRVRRDLQVLGREIVRMN
jgi:hypothetical protein